MNERRRLLGNGTGFDYLRSYAGYLLIAGLSNVMGANKFTDMNSRDFVTDFVNKNYSIIKKKMHLNEDKSEIFLTIDDELIEKYLNLISEKESLIKYETNKLSVQYLFEDNPIKDYVNMFFATIKYCIKNEIPYIIMSFNDTSNVNAFYIFTTISKYYKPQFYINCTLDEFKSKINDMSFYHDDGVSATYKYQMSYIRFGRSLDQSFTAVSWNCCKFTEPGYDNISKWDSSENYLFENTLAKNTHNDTFDSTINNAVNIELLETYAPYGYTEQSERIKQKILYPPYMNEFENLEYFHEHYHTDMKPIELSVKIDEIDLTLNWKDLKRDIYIPDGTLDNFPTGLYIHRTYYPPMLFLYKDGNECKNISGGYINDNQTLEGGISASKYNGKAINNLTSINIKANNNENDDNAIINFNTKNKLPFREYSFLGIDYSIKEANYIPEEDAGNYQLTLFNSLDNLKSNIIDINNNINIGVDRNISSFLFPYKWRSNNEDYINLFNKIMTSTDDINGSQATYFINPYKELQNDNIPYMIFKANIFWAWSAERKWSGTVLYLCRGTKDYKYPYLNKENMKYTFSKILESNDPSSDLETDDGIANKYYIDKTSYGGFYSQDSYDHKGDILANNDNGAKGYVFFPQSSDATTDEDTPVPLSAFELVEIYAPNGIYLNDKLYSHIPFDNLLSINYLVGKSNINMIPEIDIYRIYLATIEEGLKQYVFKDGDLWEGVTGGWDNFYTDTHSYWSKANYKGEIIDNEILLDFSDRDMSSQGSIISLSSTSKISNINLYESISVTYSSTTGNAITSNGCYFTIKLANVLKSSEISTGGISFGLLTSTSDITKYTTCTKTFNYNTSNGLYVIPMIISERGYRGIVKIKEIYFNKKKIIIENVEFSKDFPCIVTSTTDAITIIVKAKSILNSILYYKYESIDSSGNTLLLKDYTTSNTYNWIPQITGTYTIKVSVKDRFNNEYSSSLTNLQVHYHPNSVVIFNNGIVNDELTGGFTKQYTDTHWYWSSNCGNTKGEIIDNRLVLNHKTYGRYCYIVSLGTANKIDLSPYSTICIIYNGKMGSSRKFKIGLATGFSSSELSCVGGTQIPFNNLETNDTGNIVYDISIGNLNEERYILPIIYDDGSIYTGQYIKIHSIILIKKNVEIQSFTANVSGNISANSSITFSAIVKRRNAITYTIDAYDDNGNLIENCISGIIGDSDLNTSLWGDNTTIGSYTVKNPNNYTFIFTVTDTVTNEKVIKKITGIKVEGIIGISFAETENQLQCSTNTITIKHNIDDLNIESCRINSYYNGSFDERSTDSVTRFTNIDFNKGTFQYSFPNAGSWYFEIILSKTDGNYYAQKSPTINILPYTITFDTSVEEVIAKDTIQTFNFTHNIPKELVKGGRINSYYNGSFDERSTDTNTNYSDLDFVNGSFKFKFTKAGSFYFEIIVSSYNYLGDTTGSYGKGASIKTPNITVS